MKKARRKAAAAARTRPPSRARLPNPAAGAPPPPAPVEVTITAARGRPMLTWVGKRALRQVTAFPAQLVEVFDPSGDATTRTGDVWKDWPDRYPRGGLLFHGDNKEVLAHLLASGFRGKVNLVYIDPPFDSGADYVRKVTLRGPKGTAKLDGESYTLGEQIQYTDIWANDNYLQFMYERLLLLKELLHPGGSAYVHVDAHRCHHVRLVLDEVFGESAFHNQIAWKRTSSHGGANRFGAVTDYLLFYALGGERPRWNPQFQELTDVHRARHYRHEDGRGRYALGELTAPGLRRGPSGEPWRGFNPSTLGRHWAVVPKELERLDASGLIYWPAKHGAWPRLKRYEAEMEGRPCTDFWDDLDPINMVGLEREGYPTQKPEGVLERVILASSGPGDVVLDCFVGSGTTAAVAQRLGRRWIACDINKGAIQTAGRRIQAVIRSQQERDRAAHQPQLAGITADQDLLSTPAQRSFAIYRVNDYDLAIQHLEAVELVCEHLGVTRTRTDRYFDGTLGKRLVKIVPFNHPLTLLDLEEVRRELEARPDEDRDVVMVTLGKEPAADAWIADWNRLRRGQERVNRIEAIELRTDPRYGKFFQHQPARARIKVTRRGEQAVIEVQDFISPSIVERLQAQADLLQPKIDDWRAMVDGVLVDPEYDGRVFRIGLSDIPERKSDLVAGRYEVPVGRGARTVAVKLIDMLGEEVLSVHSLPPQEAG
jgi:DNA modification methylase